MATITPGSRVVNGARAKLMIGKESGNGPQVIGIFLNVSFGVSYHAEPVYILGKAEPAEINYLAQEVVNVTATGWRVVDNGPFAVAGFPQLQELLKQQDVTLAIYDRQTDKIIAKILNVKPVSFSTSISARQQEEVTMNFVGIYLEDETATDNKDPGGTSLPG